MRTYSIRTWSKRHPESQQALSGHIGPKQRKIHKVTDWVLCGLGIATAAFGTLAFIDVLSINFGVTVLLAASCVCAGTAIIGGSRR